MTHGQEAIDLLKQQHAQLAAEKDQIQTELQQRGQEIAQAQEEKKRLVGRLAAMERQLLTGGTKVEDHPQFHAAVQEVEERLKREYENRFEALERERARLAAEKEQFEREKTLFSRRRSEISMVSTLSATPTLTSHQSFSSELDDSRASSPQSIVSHRALVGAGGGPAPPTRPSAMRSSASESDAGEAVVRPTHAALASTPVGSTSSPTLAPQFTPVPPRSPASSRRRPEALTPPSRESSGSTPDDDPPPLLTRSGTTLDVTASSLSTSPSSVAPLTRPAAASPRSHPPAAVAAPRPPMAAPAAAPTPPVAAPSAAAGRDAWAPEVFLALRNRHAAFLSCRADTQEPDEDDDEDISSALSDYLQALRDPSSGIKTHDRRVDHQYVRGVFSGRDAVEWFVSNMQGVQTLDAAQAVGEKFMTLGLLQPVSAIAVFEPTEHVRCLPYSLGLSCS